MIDFKAPSVIEFFSKAKNFREVGKCIQDEIVFGQMFLNADGERIDPSSLDRKMVDGKIQYTINSGQCLRIYRSKR